jgi:hypothetical protein
MGTILAKNIIATASGILQDKGFDKWDRTDFLEYLNGGQREVVFIKPSAYTLNQVVQMQPGTKQSLPSGGILLLDVMRNMGPTKAMPGRVPREIKREIIDRENPNWHADTANATVLHWIYDDRDPRNYYVYPPQPNTGMGSLELLNSAAPPEIASEDDPITLDDIYEPALLNYLLFRAYSIDAEYAREDATAGAYYKMFLMLVSGKTKVDDDEQAAE